MGKVLEFIIDVLTGIHLIVVIARSVLIANVGMVDYVIMSSAALLFFVGMAVRER